MTTALLVLALVMGVVGLAPRAVPRPDPLHRQLAATRDSAIRGEITLARNFGDSTVLFLPDGSVWGSPSTDSATYLLAPLLGSVRRALR